jgi:hypothetical protein
MRVIFDGDAVFIREDGDPRFHGIKRARGESALLNYIMKWLNARGFRLFKKRAQDDGHMIGDEYQLYLRPPVRSRMSVPHIFIWNGNYAIEGANQAWNKGSVRLTLETNCFGRGQDTKVLIREICQAYPDEMVFREKPAANDPTLQGI